MDLRKPGVFVLFLILMVSCSTPFQTMEFSGEDVEGYTFTLLEPKGDVLGILLYLSDSNEVLAYPTPRMKSALKDQYRVIIPNKWGKDGRSLRSLDRFEYRKQGVINTLGLYLGNADTLPIVVFAEGFYTPVAIDLANIYNVIAIDIAHPIYRGLGRIMIHQITEYPADTLPMMRYLKIKNDRLFQEFMTEMGKEYPEDQLFGNKHAYFLKSYWQLEDYQGKLEKLQLPVRVIFNTNYPWYSEIDQRQFTNAFTRELRVRVDTVEINIKQSESFE